MYQITFTQVNSLNGYKSMKEIVKQIQPYIATLLRTTPFSLHILADLLFPSAMKY